MRIAAGFAGGMRIGETCGAVTGALMVLGLRHASADCDTPMGRKAVYDRATDSLRLKLCVLPGTFAPNRNAISWKGGE
jgi:hypothetical protein